MKTETLKVVTGLVGVGATEAIQSIDPNVINEGVGLIGQLVIIVATIISLFKRKKRTE